MHTFAADDEDSVQTVDSRRRGCNLTAAARVGHGVMVSRLNTKARGARWTVSQTARHSGGWIARDPEEGKL